MMFPVRTGMNPGIVFPPDVSAGMWLVPRRCMLEFFQATTRFNLPPVRQCGCKVVCKCDSHTCLHKWWTTRGDSGRLASWTGWSERGGALFQKLFILNHCLYWGHPLPETPYCCLLLVLGRPLPKRKLWITNKKLPWFILKSPLRYWIESK